MGRIVSRRPELRGFKPLPTCKSALGFLAVAATWKSVAGKGLKGLSLICPWDFVRLGLMVCNSREADLA